MSTNPGVLPSIQKLRDRFEFVDDLPNVEEQAALEPLLVAVEERTTGQECALKLWRKTETPVDKDLRQLWSHEFRQVERLMGYAAAHDVIVDVLGLVEDNACSASSWMGPVSRSASCVDGWHEDIGSRQ